MIYYGKRIIDIHFNYSTQTSCLVFIISFEMNLSFLSNISNYQINDNYVNILFLKNANQLIKNVLYLKKIKGMIIRYLFKKIKLNKHDHISTILSFSSYVL
jgi:hypothetical protein